MVHLLLKYLDVLSDFPAVFESYQFDLFTDFKINFMLKACYIDKYYLMLINYTFVESHTRGIDLNSQLSCQEKKFHKAFKVLGFILCFTHSWVYLKIFVYLATHWLFHLFSSKNGLVLLCNSESTKEDIVHKKFACTHDRRWYQVSKLRHSQSSNGHEPEQFQYKVSYMHHTF